MQKLLALVVLICCAGMLTAQPAVKLRTGIIVNDRPALNPGNDPAFFEGTFFNGKYYVWLQFKQMPVTDTKAALTATGVELFGYLPDKTFIASFPAGYNYEQLHAFNIYAVTKPVPGNKIDLPLFDPSAVPWAVEHDSLRNVLVSFIPVVSKSQLADILTSAGYTFLNMHDNDAQELVIKASLAQLKKIAAHPLVHYIEPVSAPPVLEDMSARSNHRISLASTSDNWVTGRKLDGEGVVVVLGDDGFIGPHIDFTGRIALNASNMAASNTHGDHCAGIILGAGNLNPTVRGQAPGATLRAYNSYADFSSIASLYNTHGARISTHSLGQSCNGGYNSDARTSDQHLITYPSMMHVHSAGNSGNDICGGLSGGWSTITGGYKAGKNVLAVANLTKSDIISSSSSKGPLPDGRIKPDVAAVGSSVNSTQPDNGFASMSGTSMASPAVAGVLAVMYQAYRKKTNGVDPNSGLMKAILMNSADDLGNEGPDFTYGFGRINARRAIECIENQRFFFGSVSQGNTNVHNLIMPANVSMAKIMVYWVDPAATAGANPSLVNDLNTSIITPSSTIELPWLMYAGTAPTPSTCSAPAIKGVDNLNNVEQLQIDLPASGVYQLNVTGSNVAVGTQTYYVVYELYYTNHVVVTHPYGGESFSPGETQRIRWDATGNTGNFTVQYSANNGSSWNTISSSVSGSQRYYDWSVPSISSGQARVRVTRGAATDMSDTTFVILGVPVITITSVCAGTSEVSWSAISGATGYDVYKLGAKFMEIVGSTTATSFTLTGLGTDEHWIAVRAKLGTRQYGRRCNAKSHTNSSVETCTMPVTLIAFYAAKKANDAELGWETAQEDGISKYIVERSADPSFDKYTVVGEVLPRNSSAANSYHLVDKTTGGKGTWYYRLRIVEPGRNVYSKIEVLKWNAPHLEVVLQPNPAKDVLSVIAHQDFGMVDAYLINETGAKIAARKWDLKKGTPVTENISYVATGVYVLAIYSSQTGELLTRQKLIVVK